LNASEVIAYTARAFMTSGKGKASAASESPAFVWPRFVAVKQLIKNNRSTIELEKILVQCDASCMKKCDSRHLFWPSDARL